MQRLNTIIPPLAHLTVQQMKKLELVSSLFPNVPAETLLKQLEQITNPNLTRDSNSRRGSQFYEL